MDTSLVGSESVQLLSSITGEQLRPQDLTPTMVFIAALVTVLLGLVYADGMVETEEKQWLQATLEQCIPLETNMRRLTHLLFRGVIKNQVYAKTHQLLTLTASLSQPERLLLLGFCYQMSAANNKVDYREQRYLQAIAKRLRIERQHLTVLEHQFHEQATLEPGAVAEVQALLNPAQFYRLDSLLVQAARDMLAVLPRASVQ
ncbi:MAG: TerB family tellurite resistance protein [Symploca sp. SIO2E6]|nr:TerB family tellurite resistance protein [Symploca sp. SIO2E6]